MNTLLSVTQVLIAIALVAIILVQRGAGAAAGSGFGAGASATVFGARGSGSFLTRTTAVLAVAFFLISFVMAVIAGRSNLAGGAPDLGIMSGSGQVSTDLPAGPTVEAAGEDDVPTLEIPPVAVPDEVPEEDVPEPATATDDDENS